MKTYSIPGHPRMRFYSPLIILNLFIWVLNFYRYQVYLEAQFIVGPDRYQPYDFSKDIGYF